MKNSLILLMMLLFGCSAKEDFKFNQGKIQDIVLENKTSEFKDGVDQSVIINIPIEDDANTQEIKEPQKEVLEKESYDDFPVSIDNPNLLKSTQNKSVFIPGYGSFLVKEGETIISIDGKLIR